MPELDPLISQYSHLKEFPREAEALHILKKVSSLVKPIMRARKWKVGTLMEFYPSQGNLLGLNVDGGRQICIRLRYAGDRNQFLPMEQIVDTMLHELSHIVFGPHDDKFNALWDQLRKEHESLILKGYTGEGFMSEGRRLGGTRVPRHEAVRIARDAAEKRRIMYAGSGQKLGGAPVRAGTDIRQVIVNAIERRQTVLKGCGSDDKGMSQKVIIDLTNEAIANGFQTKAQEDEANERAIAQALWELGQEDERKEFGDSYIPPSQENPAGNAGKNQSSQKSGSGIQPSGSSSKTTSQRPPNRPLSRLVTEPASKRLKTVPTTSSSPSASKAEPSSVSSGWTCPICTLHNPENFLSCGACTIERPEDVTRALAKVDLTKKASGSASSGSLAKTWTCRTCTTIMEAQWWTCSTCGTIKSSS